MKMNRFLAGAAVMCIGMAPVVSMAVTNVQTVQASVGQPFSVGGTGGVVVITSTIARIYDVNGNFNADFTNRGLPQNSTWTTTKGYQYNGHSYYLVATNQYVRDDDVYFYFK
ncbi:SLAP domain-containing protein [Companilactobacillus jidongensis]|uniref:SLAP domain-containing protein n=1 Tax=Companilactobacillus jidongensis TaxID=2486006 RepID=UPI000F766B20|nr:SLAP domain-containing protein [Companilactobacillus jidongensis]